MQKTVVCRPNDPRIYLWVNGEWFFYNPQEPSLGGGAMGDVYRGYSCKTGIMIAIKRVKDCYANNPMIRSRAKLEASLQFRHPNLVEMIGYCEYAPNYGPIFILSKYVQGEDVDTYIRQLANHPLRIEKICAVVCSVLDALSYIHRKKITHRDVKPSNIMVENGNNVRLMDLGIARMNAGNKFSQAGFIGTPEYSAPEQMKTSQDGTANINETTDIYALGITFYELLTGTNPMKCNTESETLTKQAKVKLPSNSNIPGRLMNVIWKATEKEQGKRYQTALEFKAAIQEALTPEPSLWTRFTLWIQNLI